MSMPESLTRPGLAHFIVADSVHLGPDGKATAYGIFNRIIIEQLPATHSMFSLLVTIGYGRPGQYVSRFSIFSPSGEKILETPPNEFELKTPRSSHNWCVQFQGFQLREEGEYRVIIYLEGDELPLADQTLFFVEKKER